MLVELKTQLAAAIYAALPGVPISIAWMVAPPKSEMGDLSLPCFDIAKTLGKNPVEIAKEIAANITLPAGVASAEPLGPYLNFRFAKGDFVAALTQIVLTQKERYGTQPSSNTRIMIEYGSPNTHKEMHVGHLRNLALGLSVTKLAEAAGHDVVAVNYLGDIGAHVAKWMWYFSRQQAELQTALDNGTTTFGRIYTEASKLADELSGAKEEIAEVQRRLEARDPQLHELWQKTRSQCLKQLDAIFAELGCHFQKTYLESQVEEEGKRLARELLEKGIAKVGEGGALIVDLEQENLGIFLILKSDGSALYSTKELALAGKKFADFPGIAKSIHVVDNRQSLYFKQLFATLKRMGFHEQMEHLAYDFVTLQEGAMSSRKGNFITYEDFRDEMVVRVTEEIRTRHTDWAEEKIRNIAWIIAEGAMKFGMVKQDNDKPIVFDMDAAISFDGFTGPYVQYAYARLSSIIAKSGVVRTDTETAAVDDAAEFALARKISDLPELVINAAVYNAPAQMARFAFELAQTVNDFYRDAPILTAPEQDKIRRLRLVEAARQALGNALALLGIRTSQEM